jgi:hypothetical protein
LPLLVELETWLRDQRNKPSRSSNVLKPINYMLKRRDGFVRFIDDGRICLTKNTRPSGACAPSMRKAEAEQIEAQALADATSAQRTVNDSGASTRDRRRRRSCGRGEKSARPISSRGA